MSHRTPVPMPKKQPPTEKPKAPTARIVGVVPQDLAADVDEARARFRRAGIKVTINRFVEVALRELLATKDIEGVMRRDDAKARRSTSASNPK